MITITIAGIIASSISFTMKKFIGERRYEKEVVSLWKELSSIRSKALKTDLRYLVKFDKSTDNYDMYVDNNNDSICDSDEKIVNNLKAKVIFGIKGSGGPDGTSSPSSSVDGNWNTSAAGCMIIENDYIGSINSGRICLENKAISDIGYMIQVKPGTQTVKLFKWAGSKWNEM